MPTIIIDVSPEQLLHAVEHLPIADLDSFVEQVLALRTRRTLPCLSQHEADLLLKANRGMPADLQRRYDELLACQQRGTITPDEYTALLRLAEYRDLLYDERLTARAELARLGRG